VALASVETSLERAFGIGMAVANANSPARIKESDLRSIIMIVLKERT
jgi:hypothetical protein